MSRHTIKVYPRLYLYKSMVTRTQESKGYINSHQAVDSKIYVNILTTLIATYFFTFKAL